MPKLKSHCNTHPPFMMHHPTQVHAEREVELAKKIGVKTVPYLVMLLDGHPYHYTEPSVSMVSSVGESQSFRNYCLVDNEVTKFGEFTYLTLLFHCRLHPQQVPEQTSAAGGRGQPGVFLGWLAGQQGEGRLPHLTVAFQYHLPSLVESQISCSVYYL